MEQNWLSISEHHLDFDVPVLVCEQGNEDSVEIARLNSKTENKSGITYEWLEGKNGYDSYWRNVTHFMFLPKALKK